VTVAPTRINPHTIPLAHSTPTDVDTSSSMISLPNQMTLCTAHNRTRAAYMCAESSVCVFNTVDRVEVRFYFCFNIMFLYSIINPKCGHVVVVAVA